MNGGRRENFQKCSPQRALRWEGKSAEKEGTERTDLPPMLGMEGMNKVMGRCVSARHAKRQSGFSSALFIFLLCAAAVHLFRFGVA
jgi:hypothetical protein